MARQANTRSVRSPSQSPNDEFLRFTSSVHVDGRLWKYDIAGSIAHAHALAHARVISEKELGFIVNSLKAIAKDFSRGEIELDPNLEDIHMNIEKLLVNRIGKTGAKLHTGRSRNDQVALDARLMVREAILAVVSEACWLQNALIRKAGEVSSTIVPGYTHLQHAQPVLLSHHLMAHFWRLQRDISRLLDSYRRTNVSPLGSGALAGTTFKLDRRLIAEMLGMDSTTENSLDAVSDRDFVAESLFALSLLMIHLSSLCEELVLWSSHEFGFLKLPRNLSSGSSMMPQKLNPDIPELVRGKSGRALGDLVTVLTLLKSLPLAYNRDLQEDKEALFDAFETVGDSLHALTAFLHEARFDKARMRKEAEVGLMTATDLADFLATRGMPFRSAHGLVKQISEMSGGDDKKFQAIAHQVLLRHIKDYRTSDLNILKTSRAIERRNIEGGTGKAAVARQMQKARANLKSNMKAVAALREQTSSVDRLVG
ncbi:MAG: argininosuccinate lyase [Thermoplasmata archaeon]